MSFIHTLLALLVVIIWGVNFIFIKLGLDEFSPLFLCALRFLFASVPAIFFIKPPAVSFKITILYGLVMFALQFTFLFLGMYAGMTPGMTSLIMQVQIFFSMFFAAFFLGEKPNPWQITGAFVSFLGIGLVALHFNSNISILGFVFVLAAAATWGIGNLIPKKISNINMVALVVWGCFVACIPMLFIAWAVEGTTSITYSLQHASWIGAISLFYIVCISTWVGYGIWNSLIIQYPIGMIVPFTLLIPIVGLLSSVLLLNEPFEQWKLMSGILVVGGLYINVLGTRLLTMKRVNPA